MSVFDLSVMNSRSRKLLQPKIRPFASIIIIIDYLYVCDRVGLDGREVCERFRPTAFIYSRVDVWWWTQIGYELKCPPPVTPIDTNFGAPLKKGGSIDLIEEKRVLPLDWRLICSFEIVVRIIDQWIINWPSYDKVWIWVEWGLFKGKGTENISLMNWMSVFASEQINTLFMAV